MFALTSIILFFGIIFSANFEKNVVQVSVFSRHCDRVPLWRTILPKCPVDIFKKLGIDWVGILTPLGESQCYEMGKSLRSRYLNTSSPNYIYGISTKNNMLDFYFASDYNKRTSRSLVAASMGLFPEGFKIDISPYTWSLPNGSSAVPILNENKNSDRKIVEYDICQTIFTRIEAFWASPEGRNLSESFEKKMDFFYDLTGLRVSFRKFGELYDITTALHYHGLLSKEIEMHYNEILETQYELWKVLFNRDFLQDLTGYYVVSVLNKMKDYISLHETGRVKKKVPQKVPQCRKNVAYNVCEWPNNNEENADFVERYLHYSGHDSGVAAILTNIKLRNDYEELRILPPYGSAFMFELIKDNGEYFVRFVFKKGFDGQFKYYKFLTYGGSGCEDPCPIDKFEKMVMSDSYVKTEDWCKRCKVEGKSIPDICK